MPENHRLLRFKEAVIKTTFSSWPYISETFLSIFFFSVLINFLNSEYRFFGRYNFFKWIQIHLTNTNNLKNGKYFLIIFVIAIYWSINVENLDPADRHICHHGLLKTFNEIWVHNLFRFRMYNQFSFVCDHLFSDYLLFIFII